MVLEKLLSYLLSIVSIVALNEVCWFVLVLALRPCICYYTGRSEIYPFVLLLVSDTNTGSIWFGFMETSEGLEKRLGLPLLGIVNLGWVAYNKVSWQSRTIGEYDHGMGGSKGKR